MGGHNVRIIILVQSNSGNALPRISAAEFTRAPTNLALACAPAHCGSWLCWVLAARTPPRASSRPIQRAPVGACVRRASYINGDPPPISGTVTRKDFPPPLCRDRRFSTIYDSTHLAITYPNTTTISYPPAFDAKDYAAYWGKFAGDPAPTVPNGPGGAGVLIYTIGLGSKVPCTAGTFTLPSTCIPGDPDYVDPDHRLSERRREFAAVYRQ